MINVYTSVRKVGCPCARDNQKSCRTTRNNDAVVRRTTIHLYQNSPNSSISLISKPCSKYGQLQTWTDNKIFVTWLTTIYLSLIRTLVYTHLIEGWHMRLIAVACQLTVSRHRWQSRNCMPILLFPSLGLWEQHHFPILQKQRIFFLENCEIYSIFAFWYSGVKPRWNSKTDGRLSGYSWPLCCVWCWGKQGLYRRHNYRW